MDGTPFSDDRAWRAVLQRDARLDGAFVYAVRTTGVYCRPSCPARRPLRRNVVFFAAALEAEGEGYRACARCGPDAPIARSDQAARRAAAILENRLSSRFTLKRLGALVGLSPSYLQRTFKHLFGLSPRAFQDARRLALFKERVRAGDSVASAAYRAGYGSSRGLYESARSGLGMTPSRYRRGGNGETIRFATRATAKGHLLLAMTERGVCAVTKGKDPARLVGELRAEFRNARLVLDASAVRPWLACVARQVEGGPRAPPDLKESAFEFEVWKALCSTPRGGVRPRGGPRTLGPTRGARLEGRSRSAS